MRKFKRMIALVTVALFIFAFAAPAGAADTTVDKAAIGKDVKGTKYEIDSKKMIALGIIEGYPDGTVKPESNVTRAEFAAIVARELDIAEGAGQSTTKFADVPASHWASGLVNIAVGKGIIQGYPDGTFKPDAPVTYAEAYAMLVRMLGYGKTVEGTVWPSGVMAKAASIGVSKKVSGGANEPMLRGDVIIAAANSLTIDLMEQVTWGSDQYWQEVDKTILEDYLDYTIYDDDDTSDETYPVVNDVPRFNLSSMDADEVTFSGAGFTNSTFTVPAYINPDDFAGQSVEFWANDDDEIVYIAASGEEEVYTDKIESATDKSGNDEIKLDASNKTYKIATDAEVLLNIADTDIYAADASVLNALAGRNIKVVLNSDDEVKFAVITEWYTEDSDSILGVVDTVDADDETIEFLNDASDLELEDYDYVIYKDGAKIDLGDIDSEDVLNVLIDSSDEEAYIVVTSDKVEGEVTDVRYNTAAAVDSFDIYVDGEKYDVAGYSSMSTYPATYSDDENDNFDELDKDALTDLNGQDVTLYLDADGKVVHVLSGEIDSTSNIGVVSDDAEEGPYGEVRVRITNTSGTEVTYTFDPDDVELWDNGSELFSSPTTAQFITALTAANYDDDFLPVDIKLDSNGDLSRIEVVDEDYDPTSGTIDINKDDDTIELTNGDFYVTDDTIIFDMTGGYASGEYDDVKVVSWSSVENSDLTSVYSSQDGDEVEYLFILGGNVTSDNSYGVIKGFTVDADGDDAVVVIMPDGEEETIRSEDASFVGEYVYNAPAALAKGQFIQYNTDADGIDDFIILGTAKAISNVVDPSADYAAIDIDSMKYVRVDSFSSSSSIKGYLVDGTGAGSIAGGDPKYYTVNSATKFFEIFDGAALKTVSGVSKNDLVLMIDTDDDGSTADYVIVIAEDFKLTSTDSFKWLQ